MGAWAQPPPHHSGETLEPRPKGNLVFFCLGVLLSDVFKVLGEGSKASLELVRAHHHSSMPASFTIFLGPLAWSGNKRHKSLGPN